MVHISVCKTYTAVLIAGPLRELPARLRPVPRLVRQPELPARSATPHLLSDDIIVRPPPYLRVTMRSGACPVSCLVTLCVRVCVSVSVSVCVCLWLRYESVKRRKKKISKNGKCSSRVMNPGEHRLHLQCSHHNECIAYSLRSTLQRGCFLSLSDRL